VKDNHRVIDIGCGWGGLMNHIVESYPNTQVTGLTLSTQQFEYINNLKQSKQSVELRAWQNYLY
jgi:cyclopropane-fatty-acyl-phospholipid synthase